MNEQLRVATAHAGPVLGQTARAANGVFAVMAALIGALLFVAMLLAIFSLLTSHTLFGWDLPYGIPSWLGALAVFMIYGAIAAPLKMIRHSGQEAVGHHPGWGALGGLVWIGFMALVFWMAYTFFPGVREVVDQLLWAATLTVSTISETIV